MSTTNIATVTSSSWDCVNGKPLHTVCEGSVSSWIGITCVNGVVKQLTLKGFHLGGTIPSSISSLSSLDKLDLSQNNLVGNIPSDIGQLTALTKLDLSSNYFTGNIPTTFGKLSNLLYLDVSSNKLSGIIPSQLSTLDLLLYLNVGNNHLTGDVPSFLCSLSLVALVLQSKPGSNNHDSNYTVSSNTFTCYPTCLDTITSPAFGTLSMCTPTSGTAHEVFLRTDIELFSILSSSCIIITLFFFVFVCISANDGPDSVNFNKQCGISYMHQVPAYIEILIHRAQSLQRILIL